MPNTVLLIDGTNAAYRFRHTCSDLSVDMPNGDIKNTGVMYGFFTMIMRYIDTYHPTSIIVAWEGGNLWRDKLYPKYKAARRVKRKAYTMEEQDSYQDFTKNVVPNTQRMLDLLGIPSLPWIKL